MTTIAEMVDEVDHDLAQAETVLRRRPTRADIAVRDIIAGARRKLRAFEREPVERLFAERYGIGYGP